MTGNREKAASVQVAGETSTPHHSRSLEDMNH
jgi:hypothetical protein